MKIYKIIGLTLTSLLAGTIVYAAGLTVPQGGTGLSSVPAGDCVKGLDALHLTSGACGSGSQTPWTQNINGGQYSLSNVGTTTASTTITGPYSQNILDNVYSSSPSSRNTTYELHDFYSLPYHPNDYQTSNLKTQYLHGTAIANGYLWGGDTDSPANVYKINLDDITSSTTASVSPCLELTQLTYAPETGYMYGVCDNGQIYKFLASDTTPNPVLLTTVPFTDSQRPSITNDGTYLYTAFGSTTGSVSQKISMATGATVWTSYIIGQPYAHNIRYDGTNLYATGVSSPGWLAKINPSTGAMSTTSLTGFNTPTDDMTIVGDYLYLGFEGTTNMAKVDKTYLTTSAINIGHTLYGMAYDGRLIWLAPSDASILMSYDPTDGKTVSYKLTTTGVPNEIVSDGQRIFYSTYGTPPYQVVRWGTPTASTTSVVGWNEPDGTTTMSMNYGTGITTIKNLTAPNMTGTSLFTGALTVTGSFNVLKNQNGLTDFKVINQNTGGSAQSRATFQSSGSLTMDIGLLGSGNAQLFNSQNAGFIWNENNGASIFGTNNTERMRMTNDGNLGIDTAGPPSLLSIVESDFMVGPGTITDNTDGTATFSNPVIVSVGDTILSDTSAVTAVVTGIVNGFTIDYSGDLQGDTDSTWEYKHSLLDIQNFDGADVLHVNSTGVGIGTANPINQLTISSGGNNGIDNVAINQTSAAAGNIYSNLTFNNTNGLIGNIFALGAGYNLTAIFGPNDMGFLGGQGHASTSMIFMTNTLGDLKFGAGGYAVGNEIMRISHNGNMGVGTTTPDSKLDVSGSVRFEGASSVVTGSISGTITGIGCDSATVTGLSGLASTTALVVTPQTDPGNAFFWKGIVLTSTSLKVLVCSDVTATPTASTYNVKIIK